MFPISCASLGLYFDSNVNLISFFIICTHLSLFGSTYITLTAQNSKTIRIIFLPKCTQKNYAFYAVFYTFFLRISVLSGKTKSALAMIFCGYFYINRPWWVSPLFNSAKIRTKGASVLPLTSAAIIIPQFIFSPIFFILFLIKLLYISQERE